MTNENMKRCSTSFVTREMRRNTNESSSEIPLHPYESGPDPGLCRQGCGATGTLTRCRWERKMGRSHLRRQFGGFSRSEACTCHRIRTIQQLHTLVFTQRSSKLMTVHTKTCTQMFIPALFITAPPWEQRRCPSVGEWISKPVAHPDTRILFRAKKKRYQAMERHGGILNAK